MKSEDRLYRELQRHLDKETIGFPETPSGSDIELLKQLFTPEEAAVTALLTFRYEPVEQIQERGEKSGRSREDTERLLDQVAAKGIIGYRKKDGVKQYRTIPYLVGMAEGALLHPSPGLAAAHMNYLKDGAFLGKFVSTKIPQMRTIPVGKSITPVHNIGNYDEIRQLILASPGPIVIFDCVCRKNAALAGNPCKNTSRKETCMALGDIAEVVIESGRLGRQISKEEALETLQQNQDDALVLQPSNSQEPGFICSCCGCCCGLLQLHKALPNPLSHWATNFFAQVNAELCTACGVCEERCQAGALKMTEGDTCPAVDLTHCLGCGLCVVACPTEAITLKQKATETVPPRTGEEMMEYIMANRQ